VKKYYWDYLTLFTLSGLIVLLDQVSKYWVRSNLAFEEIWAPWPWIFRYARIVNWQNTGAAFGMFKNFGDVFTVLAIIVSIFILYYFPRIPRQDWYLRLALILQLGGAVGNLIDRINQGYVTDFISVGNFAVFNVADASITLGVIVLLIGVWYKDRTHKPDPVTVTPEASNPPAEEPPFE